MESADIYKGIRNTPTPEIDLIVERSGVGGASQECIDRQIAKGNSYALIIIIITLAILLAVHFQLKKLKKGLILRLLIYPVIIFCGFIFFEITIYGVIGGCI